uniref:Uncharacterized protein n=1 Tax=Hyaloperonospora arabidopsidis (strain Emoy2) TaxID=559515 RepID=M4BC10_HYAAE
MRDVATVETRPRQANNGGTRGDTIFTGRILDRLRSLMEHQIGIGELVSILEAWQIRYGLAKTRKKVGALSWDADRPCCIAHSLKGCRSCECPGVARTARSLWSTILVDYPLSEDKRTCVGRYQRNIDGYQRARQYGRAWQRAGWHPTQPRKSSLMCDASS